MKRAYLVLIVCMMMASTVLAVTVAVDVDSNPSDTTPPVLAGFSFDPTTIDVSTSPQDVTFTLRITDELSGVYNLAYLLKSPSGKQSRNNGAILQSCRTSGDEFDGVYKLKVSFPQYSEAGTWHIVWFVIGDKAGNSRWIYEADFIAMGFTTNAEVGDNIPPPAPIPSLPTDGVYTNDNTPTFDWTDVTDPSTPVTYDLIVDNNADFSSPEISQTGLAASTFTPTTALADGKYSWKARARDGVGNIGPFSTVSTFTIDTVPPTSSAGSLSQYQLSLTFEIPYIASDPSPGSGVASVQLWYRLGTSEPYIQYGTFTSAPISFTATSQGTYQFYTIAMDNAGNVESAPSSPDAQTLVDRSPPTTLIALSGTPGGDGWYISDVNVILTATDEGSGVDKTEYSFDGTSWTTYDGPLVITNEGICTIYYRSVDKAQNVEQAKTETIDIDKTPPTTTISLSGTLGNNGWYISDVQVTLSAADDEEGSGVAVTEYSFDSTNWNAYTAPFAITTEGTTTVYYRSTDNAGNVESTRTQTIEIDKTPPKTTKGLSGTAGENGWYISDVKVTLTATDTGSGVKEIHYIVNTIETVAPGSTAEFTLSKEGISELEYWAVDNAGNEEMPHNTEQVEIDKTKPVITISSPEPRDYLQTESITLHFGATDPAAGSGIETVTADLDGKPAVDGQVIDLKTLPSGSHTLTVAAVDVAGNGASASVTFNVWSTKDPKQDESAKNLKQDAVAKLEGAKQLCDKESAKKIDEVIKHIEKSLDSGLWVSEMRLDPKHGQKVFEEEKEAVKKIQELLKRKDLPPELKPLLEEVIDNLVTADKMLAETSLNDAKAIQDPDKKAEHEIGESERELAKAAEELAEGHPDEAIERYKHAWEHSQNALKH